LTPAKVCIQQEGRDRVRGFPVLEEPAGYLFQYPRKGKD
jgi:hypothetical protein